MVAKNGNAKNPTPDEMPEESISTAVEPVDGFDETQLRNIETWADVANIAGVDNVVNITDVMGTGFAVVDDKAPLLDIPFVIVKYGVHKGDKGLFTTIHVVTEDGRKLIVNDGSTGIHAQLLQYKEESGRVCPLYVPRGLRMSEYDYEDLRTGEVSRARTYYLNTSK